MTKLLIAAGIFVVGFAVGRATADFTPFDSNNKAVVSQHPLVQD